MVMSDNISSHNQKGGITAKNVTVTSGGSINSVTKHSSANPLQKSRWKIWAYISGAIAFIASVVKILEYFDIVLW
jgi:hypothetical protein